MQLFWRHRRKNRKSQENHHATGNNLERWRNWRRPQGSRRSWWKGSYVQWLHKGQKAACRKWREQINNGCNMVLPKNAADKLEGEKDTEGRIWWTSHKTANSWPKWWQGKCLYLVMHSKIMAVISWRNALSEWCQDRRWQSSQDAAAHWYNSKKMHMDIVWRKHKNDKLIMM